MSTLGKLAIQGIRSFGGKEPAIIQFSKPLTTIVGANGCGKTTIIECLKYATTGALPPYSDYGKAFVHDPGMSGQTEVKAEVKLVFYTISSKPFLVARPMKLSNTGRAKQKFETLDAVIRTKDENDETVTLSQKCAELDEKIPLLLNVNKAVLQNVIFCHQEESTWPLSDSKTLKEKFDDVFASTRYSKALDTIRKEKNGLNLQITDRKARLEGERKLAEEAEGERRAFKQAKEEATAVMQEIATLRSRVDKITGRVNELSIKRGILVQEKERQFNAIQEEYTDNDDDLFAIQQNFENEVNQFEKALAELKRKSEDEKVAGKMAEREYTKRVAAHTKLAAEADAFERRVQEFISGAATLAEHYHVVHLQPGTADNILPLDRAEFFIAAARNLLAEQQEKVQKMKTRFADQEDIIMTTRVELNSKQAAVQSKLESKRQKREDGWNDREQKTLEVTRLSTTQGGVPLNRLEEQVEADRKDLQVYRTENAPDVLQREIDNMERDSKSAEVVVTQLREKFDTLSTEAHRFSQLAHRRESTQTKEMEVKRLKQEHTPSLLSVLGLTEEQLEKKAPDALNRDVGAKLRAREEAFSSHQTRLRDAELRARVVDKQMDNLNKQLVTMRHTLWDKVHVLEEMVGKDNSASSDHVPEAEAEKLVYRDIDSFTEAKEKEIAKVSKDLTIAEAAETMFKQFRSEGENDQCCPVCTRALNDVDDFLQLMDERISEIPGREKRSKRRLADLRFFMGELVAQRPNHTECKRLQNEAIPEVLHQLSILQDEAETLKGQVTEFSELVVVAQQDLNVARKLLNSTQQLVHVYHEYKGMQSELAREERELGMSGSRAGAGSLDSVRTEIEQENEKLTQLRRSVDLKRKQLKRVEQEIAQRERRLLEREHEMKMGQERIKRKGQLDEDIERLEKQDAELASEIEDLAKSEHPLTVELQKNMKEQAELRNKKQQEMDQAESGLRDFMQRVEEARALLHEISRYTKSRRAEELKKSEIRMNEVGTRARNAREAIATLQESIASKEKFLAKHEGMYRNIQDNIEYRKKVKEITEIDNKLTAFEDERRGLAGHDSCHTELHQLEENRQRSQRGEGELLGQKKVLEQTARRHQQRLNTPNLRDAAKHCTSLRVELATTQMVQKDLDRYYSALDKALMKYHQAKMSEINDSIAELWAQVYKGGDIETIEITSDTADSSGASKRRTHNYRVCMLQNNVRLDMRGRCSAGQKPPLRMEANSSSSSHPNRSFLALDEPTTNLDTANAESFALALAKLIKIRAERNSHFQIIVITHDVKWAEFLIQKCEGVGTYFQVQKEALSGHSEIVRKDTRLDG